MVERQDQCMSLTLLFYQELTDIVNQYHDFIDERLRNQLPNKRLVKLLEIFSGSKNVAKMEELNDKLDRSIQQFQISKIYDDITDQFPEQIKQNYKGKAVYNSWVFCFRAKEYVPLSQFVANYSENQHLEADYITTIAKYVDADQNDEISFREFMNFVARHIQYYDNKGARIKSPDALLEALKNPTSTAG